MAADEALAKFNPWHAIDTLLLNTMLGGMEEIH